MFLILSFFLASLDDEESEVPSKRAKLSDLPPAFNRAINNPDQFQSATNLVGPKTVEEISSAAKENDTNNDLCSSSSGLNSIYGDLNLMVKQFGKFEPFLRFGSTQIDAEMFVSTLERYLVKRYGKPDGIIEHFHVFLSEELYSWFFGLQDNQKSKWDTFKTSFINKVRDLEYDLYELSALKKDEFLAKLKSSKSDDSKLIENITNLPISTYFSEKLKVLTLVYPDMSSDDLVLNVLSHLGDKEKFKKLFKFRKDPNALVFVARLEDKKP